MNDRVSSFEPRDFTILVVLSLLFFALVVAAFWRELHSDWGPIQRRFRAILEQHGQVEAALRFTPGVRQIWIPELGVVDRCPTCHLGYEWGTALPMDLPQPFAPHPARAYLDKHTFERFGCTPCHGGQGWATSTGAAHGHAEHWTEPLLAGGLAERYGLSAEQLMQIRCNSCHRHDPATAGMDEINRAKVLVKKKKCIVCHVIAGRGGLTAPELTYYGDKNPELVDFSRVDGAETLFTWNLQHLVDADKISPGTTMPTYGFAPDEARALTLLLLSWTRQTFPPQYVPQPERAEAEPVRVVRQLPELPVVAGAVAGRDAFRNRGCQACHSVGGGELLGPDLKGVGTRRSADWLRTWLADPAAMLRAYPALAEWPAQYNGIVMPNQNLSTEEIADLVVYLGKL